MILAVAIIYFGFFLFLTYKNFKTALGLFILLLPSYFIRFNIGPLPTTILELSFGAVFLVWLIRYFKKDWEEIKIFFKRNQFFTWCLVLFLISSVVGIFISSQIIKSLGIWRAYFLEPILFFILLIGRHKEFKKDDLIWCLSLSTISVSVVAVLQKLSGEPILTSLVKADLQGRATSFFTSPNAVGLYVAPILPLILYGFTDKSKSKYYWLILTLAVLAIAVSLSKGAVAALVVACVLSVFLFGYKKIGSALLVASFIAIILFSSIHQNLLFQNRSGQNRLALWGYTKNFLLKDKKNFIFGAGISQFFIKIQKPVNNFKKIEPLIYPHNLLLNFWSEIGILGMLSFLGFYISGLKKSRDIFIENKFFGIALLSVLVVFMVHGLVDVPYFKNDLSFLWWILLAIIII